MVKRGGNGNGMANSLNILSMFNQGGGKGCWGKGKGKGKGTQGKGRKVDVDRKVWVGGSPKGLAWKDIMPWKGPCK